MTPPAIRIAVLASWAGLAAIAADGRPVEAARRGIQPEIKIELVLPEKADSKDFTIRITNDGDAAVLLYPYFTLELLDKDGKDIERGHGRLGRWGRRKEACFPENITFLDLGAKATLEIQEGLDSYGHDPDFVSVGWKLPAEGEVTLKLTYAYNHSALIARCKEGCPTHADAAKPWNRAQEFTRTVAAKVKLGR